MYSAKSFIREFQILLEKIDYYRDRLLFIFVKPYWPRVITPNHLSFFRIAIAIILFIELFYFKNNDSTLIITLFFIGIASDMLDGSVARGLGKVTRFGEILDPVADRLLILPIAIYSLFSSHKWLLLIILIFELINFLISTYAHRRKLFIETNIYGKVKMLLHSLVFLAILINWPKEPSLFFIYILWISIIFLILGIYIKTSQLKTLLKNKNE
ncbi:MAG: CDP-alcohol phosphatidyltransferase family protein [Candidatus Staskawiczbacteria bacterium]|nr:CDP-alcohol phosphatidyltransferase family protein [Candidatus Staskawiczbacteria bacterium]